MRDDFASRSELASVKRRLAALESVVAHLSRRRDNPDGRLGNVLAMIFEYEKSGVWTAGELVDDARRDRPALWLALDQITGSRGDPAVRLGRWLERHDGVDVGRYRLERVRRECNAWTYRIAEQP